MVSFNWFIISKKTKDKIENKIPQKESISNEIKQSGKKDLPTIEQLKTELKGEQYKNEFIKTMRNSIFVLVVVASAAVIIATKVPIGPKTIPN